LIKMSENCVAYTLIICGEVKHVGFRRYVWRLAKRYQLNGYVSNLPNECVEVYVEGEPRKIQELKNKVVNNAIYKISEVTVNESKCKYEYKDFIVIKCAGESQFSN